MTTITCDMCKKVIHDAHRDVNYETVRDLDICKSCMKSFLRDLEDEIEDRDPYTLQMQRKEYWKRLAKATS
jgi:ribosome-binding protein aMBF1 (putative translation factor)